MSLLPGIANRIALTAAALALALACLAPGARAQSPELQDVLDEIVGQWKADAGERLKERNCDYTAVDIAKQALQRAGFTNKAAGPVVIGALENACKGAIDLMGGGVVTNTYSVAKCVYEYYTTTKDARGLLTCLGVEVAGIAAGKLVDLLDVDPATGALTGRVIDRIGDNLKEGGVDDLAAAAKEGDIRAFARRLKEALEQVEQQARETQESEYPAGVTYTGFAYGCTVQIGIAFTKVKPPTRQGSTVVVNVTIRDCDCSANPPVGRAIEEGSVYIRVPVDFTPGPGGKPAWTPNLAAMRSVVTSKCCGGGTTRTEIGRVPGGGVPVQPRTPTDGPPPTTAPPPVEPPKPPPTPAELCPECVPIQNDIDNDRYDIGRAQDRIDAADREFQRINGERTDANSEIDRARRLIELASRRMRPMSASVPGGDSIESRVTPDGVKETTITGPDGKVKERREEPTGNRDIDSAHARIVEAQKKLRQLDDQASRARAERERAAADKTAAEAKLRADEARLKECEEQCRRRRSQPVDKPVIAVPGGGQPVQPPAGQPPAPRTPVDGPLVGISPIPSVPRAACARCEEAHERAVDLREAVEAAASLVRDYDRAIGWFEDPPKEAMPADVKQKLGAIDPGRQEQLRKGVASSRDLFMPMYFEWVDDLDKAIAALRACNRTCATADDPKVDVVVGGGGNNPFDPDNPLGPPVTQPPVQPPTGAIGTLQFSSPTYSGGEGGAVLVTVTRAGGSRGNVSVQYATGGGNAAAGADYASANGTLTWNDGEASAKSFSIALVDDTAVEDPETFNVTLSNPGGGATLGAPATATVSIADNDSPAPPQPAGNLQFSASAYSTAEGQGSVLITVTRTGGSNGTVTVQHFTGPGSATSGADYQATNGTLSWGNGDTAAKTFTVPIVDDTQVESTETFFVTLNSPTGGATLGAPATATISIADNDVAPPQPAGTIQFSSSAYSTAEGQGTVTITATRTGGSNGTVTVQYLSSPGSASPGSDYQAMSGTLAWENGDTAPKSYSVPILDDTQVESTETFSVMLTAPTGGATLGAPATATVSIADNDVATGPCGPTGSAWQPNTGRSYVCSGNCDPCPSPQTVTVNGDRVTISPFHAGGAATFTGCTASLPSESSTLTYFGQSNHRATITRSSNNNFSASIVSSGGGTCSMTCFRTGP